MCTSTCPRHRCGAIGFLWMPIIRHGRRHSMRQDASSVLSCSVEAGGGCLGGVVLPHGPPQPKNARNMQVAHRAVACFPTLRAWHARAMRSKRRSPLLFWNLSMMAQSRAPLCLLVDFSWNIENTGQGHQTKEFTKVE